MYDLSGYISAVHDEGVRSGDHEEVCSSVESRPVDADLAIVGSGNQPRSDRVDASITCDDAEAEVDRPELLSDATRVGAKSSAGRAQERSKER